MRSDLFFLVFFMIYCAEAGIFLVVAPWNSGWDRLVLQLGPAALRDVLLSPALRGAITGFGLIHLLWVLHDLKTLLERRRRLRGSHTP
ncbi:MAG: hypothetical protein AAF604_00595 [Acidobacteriota bacterium]